MPPTIRTLETHERGALLDLLDGWDVGDGWRGRDFFRRYVQDDPAFLDEDVWVAELAGELVSCVQIFPREIQMRGASVPLGGIGSVFTREDVRGQGIARAVLARCVTAMRARGMELSLLFTGRNSFYEQLGWTTWRIDRPLLVRTGPVPESRPAVAIESFEVGRDLADVVAIHAGFGAVLDGILVRDERGWRANLRVAGNPDEEFLVARDQGRVVAYARGIVMSGVYLISELGHLPDASEPLLEILLRMLAPRANDPLATSARPSTELRKLLVAPKGTDPPLLARLAQRGVECSCFEDREAMLRCLDPEGLAARIGEPVAASEDADAYLRRVLPPERFSFWAADRF